VQGIVVAKLPVSVSGRCQRHQRQLFLCEEKTKHNSMSATTSPSQPSQSSYASRASILRGRESGTSVFAQAIFTYAGTIEGGAGAPRARGRPIGFLFASLPYATSKALPLLSASEAKKRELEKMERADIIRRKKGAAVSTATRPLPNTLVGGGQTDPPHLGMPEWVLLTLLFAPTVIHAAVATSPCSLEGRVGHANGHFRLFDRNRLGVRGDLVGEGGVAR